MSRMAFMRELTPDPPENCHFNVKKLAKT